MNSKTVINKIGVKNSHRRSMYKNLLGDLIIYESIQTSKAKAKGLISYFEAALKLAKKTEMQENAKNKMLDSYLFIDEAKEKLVNVIAKRFEKEDHGLIKLFNLGRRKGDASEQVRIMLKDYKYKDLGTKVSNKPEKKVESKESEKETVRSVAAVNKTKNKSQVTGNVKKTKVKSRSGI